MGFFELFLIGIGLSMDAFAVAICKGLGMERINKRDTLLLALFFGGFQALMRAICSAAGSRATSNAGIIGSPLCCSPSSAAA